MQTSWNSGHTQSPSSSPKNFEKKRLDIHRQSLLGAFQKPEQHLAREHIVRQQILEHAYEVIGTQYKYGGVSPEKGFDCSGFIQYIHKQVDIDIPRTATAQRNKSQALGRGGIRPGDLIFFQTSSRSAHVGLYVGNGQFIHASTSRKKIVVDKLESDYWRKRFVKSGTYLQG